MKHLLIAVLLALPASGVNERWWEAYDRGVKALAARDYGAAIEALEASLVAQPNENTALKAGKSIITYVPHYWLGVARFKAGDLEGALRAWRTSEEQRAITRTDYYASLRAWVERAEAAKAEIEKEAAAKAQPIAGRVKQTAPDQTAPLKPAATSTVLTIEEPDPPPARVLLNTTESARRRRELTAAYRAYARGELEIAEQLLDALLLTWRSGEAYLLRGCARYTRSLLSGSTDLRGAASDFKLAHLLNPELKMDRKTFSPKLVSFFEQVTTGAEK